MITKKRSIKVESKKVNRKFYQVMRTSTSKEVITAYVRKDKLENTIKVMLGRIIDVRKQLNLV